jgi:hypothetical protein
MFLSENLMEKRQHGRPLYRWDNFKTAQKGIQKEGMYWVYLARNTEQWGGSL